MKPAFFVWYTPADANIPKGGVKPDALNKWDDGHNAPAIYYHLRLKPTQVNVPEVVRPLHALALFVRHAHLPLGLQATTTRQQRAGQTVLLGKLRLKKLIGVGTRSVQKVNADVNLRHA